MAANMEQYLAALKQIEIAQTFEALHKAEDHALELIGMQNATFFEMKDDKCAREVLHAAGEVWVEIAKRGEDE